MAALEWLWRRVCTPNCTNACKRYCPGCRSRADEWAALEDDAQQQAAPRKARTARIRELARCAVDCVSADVKSFLTKRAKKDDVLLQIGTDPRPIDAQGDVPGRQACGCQPPSDDETNHAATRAGQ